MKSGSEKNGAAGAILSGWVIVQLEGITLIGKLAGASLLSPVFELKYAEAVQGNQMRFAHAVFPVWRLPITAMPLPDRVIPFPCESLPDQVQEAIANGAREAQRMIESMRPISPLIIGNPQDLSNLPPIEKK